MIITTSNEKETLKFGQEFVRTCRGGELICLSGELGSGKTTFVKGLAKGLGIKEMVTSPSFVLIKQYAVSRRPLALVHIDLYRLNKPEEIENLGLSDYLGKPDKICVIEWAEKRKAWLEKMSAKVVWIKFKHLSENKRRINVKTLKSLKALKT